MKVLFVCETYPPDQGGLALAGQRISQALLPHCQQLTRVWVDPSVAPGSSHYDHEQQLIRLGPFKDEDETCQLLEQLVVHHPQLDIVHAFYAGRYAAAAVAGARRRGAPSVVSLRGNDLDRGIYRPKLAALLPFTLTRASAITCLSHEQQHKLAVWFDRHDSVRIPNSVDGDQFYPEEVERISPPLVLFSGEMRAKKGLQLALEVAAQAQGRFRLGFAGGVRGADKTVFRDWRKQHPQALVEELPYVHDRAAMRQRYAQADLVWLPALWEGMPNAVLEAMACARPVLANRVGGVPDLLMDGQGTGWTLGLHELHRSLDLILEILADPQRHQVGERARQHVLAHHHPDQETDAYLALYRRLIEDRCN